MRMNYLGAATAAALIFSSSAQAANWERVATSSDGSSVAYVEADRIVNGNGSTGAWVKMVDRGGISYISLIAVRCSSQTYLEIKSTYYNASGSSTSLNVSGNWDMAVPGSMMDAVIHRLC